VSHWFKEHVEAFGNVQPDTGCVIIPSTVWANVYEHFTTDLAAAAAPDVASFNFFCVVIRRDFPPVKARKHRGISGKCDTCDLIDQAIALAKADGNQRLWKQYLKVQKNHNLKFNGRERSEYVGRRRLAETRPLEVNIWLCVEFTVIIEISQNIPLLYPCHKHSLTRIAKSAALPPFA
jgi:hypothetical protein